MSKEGPALIPAKPPAKTFAIRRNDTSRREIVFFHKTPLFQNLCFYDSPPVSVNEVNTYIAIFLFSLYDVVFA